MNNIQQIINDAKRSGNIQKYVLNHIPTGVDPLTLKCVELIKNNDTKGMEQMVRNICKEKGIDVNTLLKMANTKY